MSLRLVGKCLLIAAWLILSGFFIANENLATLRKELKANELNPDQVLKMKSDVQIVADSITSFGLDFYRLLASNAHENIIFSPYNLSGVMVMAYEGAGGKTAEEIRKVFHFPASFQVLGTGFRVLIDRMKMQDGLRIANAIWLQRGYNFRSDYLKKVGSNYQWHAFYCDFLREPGDSVSLINKWVRENTYGRISELLERDSIGSLTRLILTGAIYFKGEWVHHFDENSTEEQDFWVETDKAIRVPMMRMSEALLRYDENDEFQALEISYKWNPLSLVILLPRQSLPSIENRLDFEKWKQIKDRLREEYVMVYLPRFKFNKTYKFRDPLTRMGMSNVFSMGADFSALARTEEPLFINDIIQKALIGVDEKGTEAAAATTSYVLGGVVGNVATSEPKIFRADRPFIFIIQEKITGVILFLGQVVDPTK
ncbi:MAG: serpin family protein [Candidatus Aminicenantes bacterium]|nr:serpin family protein [Candidatus Aminicenantes bacterium]